MPKFLDDVICNTPSGETASLTSLYNSSIPNRYLHKLYIYAKDSSRYASVVLWRLSRYNNTATDLETLENLFGLQTENNCWIPSGILEKYNDTNTYNITQLTIKGSGGGAMFSFSYTDFIKSQPGVSPTTSLENFYGTSAVTISQHLCFDLHTLL